MGISSNLLKQYKGIELVLEIERIQRKGGKVCRGYIEEDDENTGLVKLTKFKKYTYDLPTLLGRDDTKTVLENPRNIQYSLPEKVIKIESITSIQKYEDAINTGKN